jgi:peptidoglycan/xylan/chitin deacetylase (PgdA/CDA1 family)
MGLSAVFKRVAKRIGSPLLDATGLPDREIGRRAGVEGSWTILMYHRVIDDPRADPYAMGMCVRRRHFAEQLDALATHFRIEPVGEVVARLRRGERVAPRTLSITFDDGYLDNADIAVPMLRARGIPASFYVATGGLDIPEALWWDRVINAVDASRERGTVTGVELGVPAAGASLSLALRKRERTATALLDALWTLPHAQVLAAVSRIEARLAPDRAAAAFAPRMDSHSLARLAADGFEVGAHTVSHPNLVKLSPADVIAEADASRRTLQRITGTAVAGFAYPAGHFGAHTTELIRQAGFDYAVSVVSGVNGADDDRFALRRIGAPDTARAEFKVALARAMGRRPASVPTLREQGSGDAGRSA